MRGNHVKTKYDLVRAFAPWAMVCSVTIWGYSYVVTKIALNVHTDPLILTAGCYIYGALGAAPLIFIKRHELLKKGVLTEAMVMGAALFISKWLQSIGCQYTTAGKNAFITGAYVVIVPFFMRLLFKTRLIAVNMAAAVLALAGIGIISVGSGFGNIQSGDFITFGASVGFALHIALNGHFAKRHDPLILGGMQLVFAAIFSVIACMVTETVPDRQILLPNIQICLIYSGVLGMAAGMILQSFGQKYVAENKAAMILSMESVSGAVFSIICLHDPVTPRFFIGCMVIFAALLLVNIQPKKDHNSR